MVRDRFENRVVVWGKWSARFAWDLVGRYQRAGVGAALLAANAILSPETLRAMAPASAHLIIAIGDIAQAFDLRAAANAPVEIFSDNGVVGIVAKHHRSAAIGTVIDLGAPDQDIPSVLRQLRRPPTVASAA